MIDSIGDNIWPGIVFLFGGVGLVVVSYLIKKSKELHLEKPKEFLPEVIDIKVRRCGYNDANIVSEISNYYLNGHGVSAESVQKWLNVNDDIIYVSVCTNNKTGISRLCGYYSIFPLEISELNQIKKGTKEDRNISSEKIISWNDTLLSEIFIADLITDASRCKSKRVCVRCGFVLLAHLRRKLASVVSVNTNIDKICTITASKNGEKLAQHFGFFQIPFESELGWKLWERYKEKP